MAIKRYGATIVTYSFTTGATLYEVPDWNIRCDTDALAYALYLERRGRNEEAEEFLEQYLRQCT